MHEEDPFLLEEALARAAMCAERRRRSGEPPADEEMLSFLFLTCFSARLTKGRLNSMERAEVVRTHLKRIFSEVSEG